MNGHPFFMKKESGGSCAYLADFLAVIGFILGCKWRGLWELLMNIGRPSSVGQPLLWISGTSHFVPKCGHSFVCN